LLSTNGKSKLGGVRSQVRVGREALPYDDAPAADVAARLAERDAREAMDTRTLAERWLGDPPWWRSVLRRVEIDG
jgi:hypothetical protein